MISLSSLFGILWAIFIIYWLVSAARSKKTIRDGTWQRGAMVRIVIALLLIVLFSMPGTARFFVASESYYYHSVLLDIIAVILWFVGIGLAVWARIYLGTNWGMPMSRKENPELVTTGPYRFVRHPIYTGVLLAIIATALIGEPFWLIWLFFSGIYFVYSAFKEDQIMARQFPDQYPEYKKRTKMLIPFI